MPRKGYLNYLRRFRCVLEYRLLIWISPSEPHVCMGEAYRGKSKLRVLLGDGFFSRLKDKTVIDFGCGEGDDALELARSGARRVIGIDIQEDLLEEARRRAKASGLEDVCRFTTFTEEAAEVIVSLDSFEHFGDPAGVLRVMDKLLVPGGEVVIAFGPTWYHPYGGHLFSMFPWAHLLFSEPALIRWRARFKSDGATVFSECQGGLNRMTIGWFERLVNASPFRFLDLEVMPIGRLRHLQNHFTREFTTSFVRCRLVRRAEKSVRTAAGQGTAALPW